MSPIHLARRRLAARVAAVLVVGLVGAGTASAGKFRTFAIVSTSEQLQRTLAGARPGLLVWLESGVFQGGIRVANVRGTAANPIALRRMGSTSVVIRGGANGLHLTDVAHLEIEDLVFEGQTGNGINVDDGGTPETPSEHVRFYDVTVRDVGPRGNCDGIKLSGVRDSRLDSCTVERWGDGGSAVDMVGCRRVVVEGSTFRHLHDAPNASGVQAKGGSEDVTVRRNRFVRAGGRAVNVGGSTGLPYFRPPLLEWKGERFEARGVRVVGNTFVGGTAAVAFVGADRCVFRWNTVYVPDRWFLRILQETREPGFVPCRLGEVRDNVVAFRSDRWSEGGVNVGPGTEAASFRFDHNVWFCVDAPARTKDLVRLPAAEKDSVFGVDPDFPNAGGGDLRVRARAAGGAGADSLP